MLILSYLGVVYLIYIARDELRLGLFLSTSLFFFIKYTQLIIDIIIIKFMLRCYWLSMLITGIRIEKENE